MKHFKDKPKVVVTGPDTGGLTAWLFTAFSVKLAGGVPIRVTPSRFSGRLNYDAYIIGGGSDIHPSNRKAESVAKRKTQSFRTCLKEAFLFPMEFISRFSKPSYDKRRDEMEKKLISFAVNNHRPMLGICRGHQLINAHLGGTLIQSTRDLLGDSVRARSVLPRKTIFYAKKHSRLRRILGDAPIKVNAIHSQAIAETAESLEMSAIEKSGIIQAIETKDGRPLLGVQWHPEYLVYMSSPRALCEWLVNGAKK